MKILIINESQFSDRAPDHIKKKFPDIKVRYIEEQALSIPQRTPNERNRIFFEFFLRKHFK
jgi:hypothetical protein